MNHRQPCALLVNDMHISKNSINEFNKNWKEALDICAKRNIPEIIIGGDLWLSRSSQTLDVLLAVKNAILMAAAANIKLTIAEGNHDLVDQEGLQGYSHIFDSYSHVTVIDDYIIRKYGDDVMLYIMSYFPEDGSFTERYNKMLDDNFNEDMYNILYIHQGISGALSKPSEKELPAQLFVDFNVVLVGHYHNRCVIEDSNVEYIGSSRQHNFGEDEEKGYTVLYDDGTYEFVKNKANVRYYTMDIGIEEIGPALYRELQDMHGLYMVRVRVHCKTDQVSSIDRHKLIDCGATKIEIVTEQSFVQSEESAVDVRFDKSEIQNEYKAFCDTKGINNKIGLTYLQKI